MYPSAMRNLSCVTDYMLCFIHVLFIRRNPSHTMPLVKNLGGHCHTRDRKLALSLSNRREVMIFIAPSLSPAVKTPFITSPRA